MGRLITAGTPGHPYDNSIRQADTRYTPTLTITTNDFPPICGNRAPYGRTNTCLRQIRTSHLHSDLADITREIASLARIRNDWRARNLIGHIEFAVRRLTFQMNTWDIPTCTCPDDLRRATPTHDLEDTYPACTC